MAGVNARPELDVLAQPVRAGLFERLYELGRPAPTVELADELDLHPNGVRAHLAALAASGLVRRERARRGRGRPRDLWSVAPGAVASREDRYVQLAGWLARVVEAAGGAEALERAGRDIGRELVPGAALADRSLGDMLAALGFAPERLAARRTTVTYRLGRCPYRAVVREHSVTCALHQGITLGLLDALSPETELTGFVARDPDEAGCLIELRGPLARADAGR